MPSEVQWRGGNTSQNNNFTGAEREVTVNEDTHALRVHDGVTVGGYELARADLSNAVGIVSITASGNITADGFVTVGGSSTQFLKADGSIDSNAYLSSYTETDTLNTVTSRGNITTNGISVGVVTASNGNFSGIVTANSGFNIGISSAGTSITSGPIKTLNFIGAGNTFSVTGSRVDISVSGATNISYDSSTRTLSSSTGIGTTLPLVGISTAGLQRARGYGSITYAATVTLDMAALNGQVNSIALAGDLMLATLNLAVGQEVELRLVGDSSQRALTFPSGWRFQGIKPANIPANKVARLSLQVFGTTDAGVDAVCTVQS